MGIVNAFLYALLGILGKLINLYFHIVAVDIILYWMLHYKIMTVHNKYSEKFMDILRMLTEPVYSRIRKKIPPISGYDVAPYILLLILIFIGLFITNLSDGMAHQY